MKCGRVYHANGVETRVVPTAILSGPIHILGKRDGERGPSGFEGERGRKWFPPGEERASGKTCFWHDKKSRAEVDARFLSHSNPMQTPRISIPSFLPKKIFPQRGILRPLSRKSHWYVVKKPRTIRPASEKCIIKYDREICIYNNVANALQHLFKFLSSYKVMKGGSCINFSVESSLQLQLNHGTR